MLFLTELVIVALLAASFWTWIHALRTVARGRRLLHPEPHSDPPWGLADLLLTMVILVVGQGAGEGWVRVTYQLPADLRFEEMGSEPRAMLLLASALATLGALVCSLAWVVFRGASWRDLGLRRAGMSKDIGLGVLAFTMVAPLVYGLQWLLVQWTESKHPLIELLKEHPDPGFLMLSTFSAVLVAPVAEEYLFRVLLQGWLERLARGNLDPASMLVGRCEPAKPVVERDCREADDEDFDFGVDHPDPTNKGILPAEGDGPRPPFWPILVSSALFAGAHWSHGPDPIPLFLFAAALGYLYQRTRRVFPCIVVHFLLNGCSLAALWIDVYRGSAN